MSRPFGARLDSDDLAAKGARVLQGSCGGEIVGVEPGTQPPDCGGEIVVVEPGTAEADAGYLSP